jgi:sec-independent protein translocase protein TatC
MTFFEHLGDLRRALFRAALAFVAALAVTLPLAPRIFGWLTLPLEAIGLDPAVFLRQLPEPTAGMQLAMSTALWSALVLALPFMLLAFAGFVFPGLTRRERRAVTGALIASAFLFLCGVALAAFLMLPPSLRIMLWFSAWMGPAQDYWWATHYVRFVLLVLAAFGLTFQLPLAVMLLGHLGILTSEQLRAKRRHAIVFILILAAIITPTQDPVSLFILALPLTLLYEISIWTTWASERRRSAPRP